MSTGAAAMTLTHKEVQTRGLDILSGGLEPFVSQRMTAAAHGKDWVSLYEAKETQRLGRPFHANSNDPRLLLRILRYERAVFTEIHATQRAWLDELIQSSNRAAHSTGITAASADRALDTMLLLADSLDMQTAAEELTSLRASSQSDAVGNAEEGPTAHDSVTQNAPEGSSASPQQPSNGMEPAQTAPVPPQADSTMPSQSNQRDEIRPAIAVPADTAPPKGTQRLSARMGDLDVVVLYREAVNYALVHNGVSLIIDVSVTNRGESPIEETMLDIELLTPPGQNVSVGRPLQIPLGSIDPFQSIEVPLQQLVWRLNPELFVLLDEAVLTGIQLTVRTKADRAPEAVRDYGQVRLLTAEEWWALSVPELLGAFVRPNDPAVAGLLADASARLARDTQSPSLEGYQSGPERVHQIAEAIYEAMADRHVTYVEPPASFEGTGQRIRTHSQVLNEQRGTCLDLACTYAAALEQAGLHPVLVLTEGHAFTGYLTEETELPTLAVTQQGAIATIADSDMFDAVETTAVCDGPQRVSFDQARGRVRRWWRADLGKVDYLLDLRAAHRLVRPMPSIRMEDGTRVVEVVSEQPSTPARALPASSARHAPRQDSEALPGRVDRWQKALLDMTYRNPLLKLKKASSTVVHVPSSMLAPLEDKVAAGESIELVAHDDLAQIHHAQGHRTAADVDAEALGRIMREENRLFVALTAREYTRRLKNLQRKARTSLDETGTDNLYLALGTLHWTDHGKEGRAPIFLLPVRLTGGRGGSRFTLSIDETRSLQPNYCLVEKLRTTWGLKIPELTDPGEDDSGIDVANSLAAIRSALLHANRQSFHVEETAHLALLQFATLDMWRDLRLGWEKFMRRPVVKHLVETPGQPFVEAIEPPATDASAEATSYLPIPADGSQIEAVRWAAAGKTFILEGPPGTGKSQTITNLIANCLAQGQKVLFVAEKQAALNVVKQRLDDVGLGVLSLDVHGKNQTVAAVREQLTNALKATGGGSSSWDTLRARYREVVESLSRYPVQLHEDGPVDISAWSARQIILELGEGAGLQPAEEPAQSPEVEVPRSVVMGGVNLDEVYDGARDLANALLDLGVPPGRSPWRLSGPLNPEMLDRAGVAAALQRVQAADAYLTNSAVRAGLALTNTPAEFAAIANWLDAVQAGAGRTTTQARDLVTAAWNTQADQASAAVATFRSAQSSRLGDFRPAALEVDLDAFIERSMEIDGRLLGKKKRRLALLRDLGHVLRHEPAFPVKDLTNVLKGLATLRGEMEALVQYVAALPGMSLPYRWNVLDEEHPYSLDAEIWGIRSAAYLSRSFSTRRPADDNDKTAAASTNAPGRIDAIDQMTVELLSNPNLDDLPAGEPVRELSDAWQNFRRLLNSTEADYTTWLDGRNRAEAMTHAQQQWAADASGGAFINLHRWLRVRHALARLEALGLPALGEPVLTGALRGAEVERAIRLGVARAILAERLDSTGLASFDDRERQRWVERFLATGEDLRERMTTELGAQVVNKRFFDPAARTGMVADLRQQLRRRRGGLSVRQIMDRFGSLIPEITPCFLMSPASVARFLPVGAVEFDVVVFDEASQIRVPQAIGAMGRGQSVVIVGDSKQMPPSSMFAASGLDDDEDETPADDALPVPIDLESILSEGAESSLPRRLLSWHYRSRDEALIAFSNNHYYEGGLSTFPAPPGHASQPAVQLQRVDGTWEGGSRGAARINRAEAEAIVSEIRHLLEHDDQRSIGVVTFNTQQRDHILNLLDDARSDDVLIDSALGREDDALFVKNLENVQGDERDIVLFSLAFARDKNGTVPLNWGPLSRKGGERRFNVAVTRAKEQVQVFCSFDPHELDLSRSKAQGLADLKDYLLAARDGIESTDSRRAPIRDQHREDIVSALRDAGLEVLERVGLSDFTVDIAARCSADHPWIGVLLDGPTWAARESVGDREGLPTTILTDQMGWRAIERVWLPTWVRDRAAVIDHIVDVAAQAEERDDPDSAKYGTNSAPTHYDDPNEPEHLSKPLASDLEQESLNSMPTASQGPGHPVLPDPGQERSIPSAVATSGGQEAPDDTAPVRSQTATDEAQAVPMNSHLWSPPPFTAAATEACYESWMLDDQTRRSRSTVRSEILDVIQVEGPILADRLARIVAARFDLSRVRRSRRDQLLALAPGDSLTPARNGDAVYWPEGVDPAGFDLFRVPTDGETRDIDEIPYEELRNAMGHVVRRSHGMSRADALKATMHTFNVQRLGSNVRERLEGVLDAAIAEGLLAEQNGMVTGAP